MSVFVANPGDLMKKRKKISEKKFVMSTIKINFMLCEGCRVHCLLKLPLLIHQTRIFFSFCSPMFVHISLQCSYTRTSAKTDLRLTARIENQNAKRALNQFLRYNSLFKGAASLQAWCARQSETCLHL